MILLANLFLGFLSGATVAVPLVIYTVMDGGAKEGIAMAAFGVGIGLVLVSWKWLGKYCQ